MSLLNCANCGAKVEGWAATDSHCPNGCISTLTKDPEFDYRTKDSYCRPPEKREEKIEYNVIKRYDCSEKEIDDLIKMGYELLHVSIAGEPLNRKELYIFKKRH